MKTIKKTTKKSLAKAKPVKAKPALKPKIQTAEQVAEVSKAANSFEGVERIDHLPFEEQMSKVFNPLNTITKTAVRGQVTPGTFVVKPKK